MDALDCGVGEDTCMSFGQQGDQTSQSYMKSVLNIHWKDWCWSRNSNTLATWSKELTHWKRPWCWERLTAGGDGDDRGWDGWMASLTRWTWVWASSRRWWWTGRPGCSPWGCKESDTTERLDWTELNTLRCLYWSTSPWHSSPHNLLSLEPEILPSSHLISLLLMNFFIYTDIKC